MKKIYILFLLVTLMPTANAQVKVDTPLIVSAYFESDYIFEGIVTQQCVYEDSDGNLYTSNQIEISKIFKGSLECGTINLITLGGETATKTHIVSDYVEFNIGVMGIFMCKNSDYPSNSCQEATNSPEVMLTLCEIGSLQYLFDRVNAEVEGFNSQFPTIEALYEFLDGN